MELKFMQNSSGTTRMGQKTVRVETTMTLVNLYDDKGELIGSAGVNNPYYFDYNTLLRFAKHKSGSKIQVA